MASLGELCFFLPKLKFTIASAVDASPGASAHCCAWLYALSCFQHNMPDAMAVDFAALAAQQAHELLRRACDRICHLLLTMHKVRMVAHSPFLQLDALALPTM